MKVPLCIVIVSRVKLQDGNYMGMSEGYKGKYFVITFSKDMEFLKLSSAEEWIKVRDTNLENGSWKVYVPKTKQYPVSVTSETLVEEVDKSLCNVFFGESGTNVSPLYPNDGKFLERAAALSQRKAYLLNGVISMQFNIKAEEIMLQYDYTYYLRGSKYNRYASSQIAKPVDFKIEE